MTKLLLVLVLLNMKFIENCVVNTQLKSLNRVIQQFQMLLNVNFYLKKHVFVECHL